MQTRGKASPRGVKRNTERRVLGSFNHVNSAISIPLTGCWRLNSLQCLQRVWGYLDVSEYLNANYYKIFPPRGYFRL